MDHRVSLRVSKYVRNKVTVDFRDFDYDSMPAELKLIFQGLKCRGEGRIWGLHSLHNLVPLTILHIWSCLGSEDVEITLTLQQLLQADIALDSFQPWRCYEDLLFAVRSALDTAMMNIPDVQLPHCVELVEQLKHDRSIAAFRAMRHAKCFQCLVCCSWFGKSIELKCSAGAMTAMTAMKLILPWLRGTRRDECPGHSFCPDCLRSWASQTEQLQSMVMRRSFSMQCMGFTRDERCHASISSETLATLICSCRCMSRRLCSCSRLARLGRDLQRRAELLQQGSQQHHHVVECPQPGCVGVGFSRNGTAMCWLCEHQWSIEGALWQFFRRIFRSTSAGWDLHNGIQRCPSCNAAIYKDGGCDHMTCRCGYEFYWSSLRRYRGWSSKETRRNDANRTEKHCWLGHTCCIYLHGDTGSFRTLQWNHARGQLPFFRGWEHVAAKRAEVCGQKQALCGSEGPMLRPEGHFFIHTFLNFQNPFY